VDAAAAVDASDGVRRAPPLHRFRPFFGQIVLRESLQSAYELAIHDSRGERIELAGDRGYPSFVEERQSVADLAREDETSRLGHPSDGSCSRVAARTHLDGPPSPLSRAPRVACEHPFVVADHREPCVHWRVPGAVEETLGAREPTADGRHERSIEEQMHGDADGRTCGGE